MAKIINYLRKILYDEKVSYDQNWIIGYYYDSTSVSFNFKKFFEIFDNQLFVGHFLRDDFRKNSLVAD